MDIPEWAAVLAGLFQTVIQGSRFLSRNSLQLLYMGDIKVVQPEDGARGWGDGGARGENTETIHSLN